MDRACGSGRLLLALVVLCVAVLASGGLGSRAFADEGASLTTAAASAKAQEKAAEKHAYRVAQLKAKLDRKTLEDGLYSIGLASQKGWSVAMGGASKANGAQAVPAMRADADWSQKWAIAWDAKSGYYTIRNLNSRKYLGVAGRVKAGATVKQFAAVKSASQLWEPVGVSGGIAFRPAGSSCTLAAVAKKGATTLKLQKATTAKAKAHANQKFKLRAVDALEDNLTYYVRNLSTGKRLHVSGESRSNGAAIDLAAPSAAKSQKFRLLKTGESTYRLQNVGSCYCVGANAKGGGAARQYSSYGGKRTQWEVRFNPKAAAFSIEAKASSKCLDGSSGKLALKDALGTSSQLFTFARTYAFKVYLNPGHGWNSNGNGVWDSGATGSGHEEAEFSHDLAHRVEARLAGTDVKAINGEQFGLAFWHRMPKAVSLGCDAIVSLHFDAGAGSGTLKMVGTHGKAPGSDELAEAVHQGVVSHLGLPDRGPVSRSDITCVNGAIPSMLTEVCFMDNEHDVQVYLSRRDAVAQGIAEGILSASRNRAVLRSQSEGASIAGASTTRAVVRPGARDVPFESVTLGQASLVEGRDYTLGYYEDYRVLDKAARSTEKLADADVVIYEDGSAIHMGRPCSGPFAEGVAYCAVLKGTGSYTGVHLVPFQARGAVEVSALCQEADCYEYSGKAIVPRYYVGSPSANDREVVPSNQYKLTLSKRLFSETASVKKAVGYANYSRSEYYTAKVSGTKVGLVSGARSFAFRIYKPADISKCLMTQRIPDVKVGSTPEYSLWYSKRAGYGDYVPSFLYTSYYLTAKGKKITRPTKTGSYTLVVEGNPEYGCKGKQTRKVRFVKKAKDIGVKKSRLKVLVTREPVKANGYKPSFRVVDAKSGKPLAKRFYRAYYIDFYDRVVSTLKGGKGALVVVGKGRYTGHITHYIGEC